MSLRDARPLPGATLPLLPAGPPYACADLTDWSGAAFWMPPGDPRLEALHNGDPVELPPCFDNLVGAAALWEEHPEWMEFMDPSSPTYDDKRVERALYLDRWERHLPPGCRVLDVGGGVGRFSLWLLGRGCEVELVDPDLRSLWRAVRSAPLYGRGALDVHWSTGEALPAMAPVDVVVAAEVLCYVEDPAKVVANLAAVLKPGGRLLCSVEASFGWAMAMDAAEDSIECLFRDDGVVHVPGDRWVQTYSEASLRALLETHFDIDEIWPSHYAFSGPFEHSSSPQEPDEALELEARLRAHPIAGALNRAWMVSARLRASAA